MSMAIERKKVAEQVQKSASAGTKKKYTYSLNEALMTRFNEDCDKDRSKYGDTLEQLVSEYLGYKSLTHFLFELESKKK